MAFVVASSRIEPSIDHRVQPTHESRDAPCAASAIAVSPSAFDFQVRERPRWFRPDDHAHMMQGLRKAGYDT